MFIARSITKKATCTALTALLCAMLCAPCGALAKEGDRVTDESKTVRIDLAADGSVMKSETETLLKYESGDTETIQSDADVEAPVNVKVSYTLDGAQVSPSELAGKSGEVSIRYDYENTSVETVSVNGKVESVHTPFTAITALMLDKSFTNIEVTNAKTIEDGDTTIIAGYSLPGLKESLGEIADSASVPEYFEVRARVEDFELKGALTVVTAGLFSDVDENDLSLGELGDVPDSLSAAMSQVIEGSDSLTAGLDMLAQGNDALHEGIAGVNAGAGAFEKGAQSAQAVSSSLAQGATNVSAGLSSVVYGDGTQANPGISEVSSSVSQIADGLEQLSIQQTPDQANVDEQSELAAARALMETVASDTDDDAIRQAAEQAVAKLDAAQEHATQGASNQQARAQATESQLKQASASLSALSVALNAEASALKQLSQGAEQLQAGANQLNQGVSALSYQSTLLSEATSQLEQGSSQLVNGARQAVGGSQALGGGLRTFNEVGIGSINDAIDNKYGAMLDKMGALVRASKEYDGNYASSATDANSSVKFVYETAAISKDS